MIEIRVKNQTPELMQKVEAAISRFVRKSALYIEGEIKSSMAEPKSGNEYKRGTDKIHVASAPGESPAVDSSNLIGSIMPQIKTLEAKVGTPVEYAQYLETGTSRIDSRPVWEKTATEVLPTLENLLKNELRAIR